MYKLAIYPFSQSSSSLYEFFPIFQPEYEVTHVVSPVGLGFAGHDASFATNRSDFGITVQNNIDQALNECDALLVPFGNLKTDPAFFDAFDVMCKAAEQGKVVFCASKLTHSQYKKLNSVASVLYYGFYEESYRAKYITTNMYKPSVPVVFVHNLTFEADSFEVTLSLAQRFRRDGVRVTVIGARPEYNFFGMNGSSLLLDFFYGNHPIHSVAQCIQNFHHYLRTIELFQHPEVILINIPGGALSTQNYYYNEAGVFAYLMSRIVRPDYAVVCMPYADLTVDVFQTINKELLSKFDCGLDLVHFSNKILHAEQTRLTEKEQTLYIPEREVVQKAKELRKIDLPIYCALVEEEKEFLYRKLLNKLMVS